MNGGARVAQVLKNHNLTHLFTLCGGHISPILVESKKQGITVVDVRHEASAAFCADAYSRLTGKVGVAAVTAGPGVTNTITAIKNAQLAQSPLVLLGGATATLLRGRGSLQDIDQMQLIRPHVKWAARPNLIREVIPTLERAFQMAKEDVPGPVFVELAVDLLYDEQTVRNWTTSKTNKPNPTLIERMEILYIQRHLRRLFSGSTPSFEKPQKRVPLAAPRREVSRAKKWIEQSHKPVFIIGSQALQSPTTSEALVTAINTLNVPTFLSGMARGLLGKDHPLQLRHNRSQALKESDVVLLCGVPCDFRLNYGKPLRKAKVISINRSRKDLYQNRRPDLPILADPQETLVSISKDVTAPNTNSWLQTLRRRHNARDQQINEQSNESTERVNPLLFCRALDDRLTDNSILVGDGGDFVASASYILQPRSPYSWLDPGVFGTLGVGAGFAMSAKLTRPNADVWLLYGDGAAGFSIMEFESCVRQRIPIIAVVGNDAGWTQIARDQVVILKDNVGTELSSMDYHKVAIACGGHGIVIRRPEEISSALEEAIQFSRSGTPVLINVLIGKTDFRKGSISM